MQQNSPKCLHSIYKYFWLCEYREVQIQPYLRLYCLLTHRVLAQPLLLLKAVTGLCVQVCIWSDRNYTVRLHRPNFLHSSDRNEPLETCRMLPLLCDGKASYRLLIPTPHTRHFLSPVMLMQLEFHKSNLSSKKVNKFTLYNWKPYWWLKGFYISVFWVTN